MLACFRAVGPNYIMYTLVVLQTVVSSTYTICTFDNFSSFVSSIPQSRAEQEEFQLGGTSCICA